MPKTGYKSITVTDEFYQRFNRFWESQRKQFSAYGVYSASAFATKKLEERFQEREQLQKFARKITKFPKTVTVLVEHA